MRKIFVNEPVLDGNEKKYLNECIDSGWISHEGPFIERFEKEMAFFTGRKYAVSVSSGSAALETAVTALQLEKGDEVIMPAFTIISCIAPLIRRGIKPVLIDSCLDTWNMRTQDIEQKITKNTKAIMAVHIYGLPVDMNPVLSIAEKYGLFVIEDAAEMHGQNYRGKPCGSFGDISIFSFYPNKHITSGEGGMVLTDNRQLAERSRGAANLFFGKRRYVHEELGYNFRMCNLQAAVACAQLERIEHIIKKKREMGRLYHELLIHENRLQLPKEHTEYADNIYWVYGVMLKDDVSCDSDAVMKKLAEKGVSTRPFFWCMHEQPVLRKMGLFENESYPNAEKMARRGFYLPSGLNLTEDDQRYVVQKLCEVFDEV